MSEPTAFADHIETIEPAIEHWSVRDDRIEFRSDAYAVATPEGKVLVDPLPLSDAALDTLGKVAAIVLIEGQHQRAAWRFRRRLEVPVYAPEGAVNLEESPDRWYADGDDLPGGLRAVQTDGFGTIHCALVLESDRGRALFSGDLVVRSSTDDPFSIIPDKYVDDAPGIRRSIAKLADLAPDTLCPGHGAPVTGSAAEHLREVLQRDAEPD